MVSGDIDADGISEIVVGSPPGVSPIVYVYEQGGTLIRSFSPYTPTMRAGLHVAVGDVTGTGSVEIIVAPRRGVGPHILRFSSTGRQLSPGFFAYVPQFRGGVNLAIGDVTGDGINEIITGPSVGGGPHVSFFTAAGVRLGNIFPYEPTFRGGLVVGAVDYDGDGISEIVVAPQSGRVADILVYRAGTRELLTQFRAFGDFKGGVSLSVNASGGTPRVLLGAGAGGGPQVLQYNLLTRSINGVNVMPVATTWRGGMTVAFVAFNGSVQFFASPGATRLDAGQLSGYSGATPVETVGGGNSSWERLSVATASGTYTVQAVRVSLTNPKLQIKSFTDVSGERMNVASPVRALKTYVDQVDGFAGINGSYFCPADYAACAGKAGSFYWLWYNSPNGALANSYQNQFNPGPVIAFDTTNQHHYFRSARDWPGKEVFEQRTGKKLAALISNGPGLVFGGELVVTPGQLDDKQRTVKSARSGIGFKGTDAYLVVASGATVMDLGYIMKSLGMQYAMNLDGGGSSALYYAGQYRVGPGRNMPNALVFVES